MGEAYTPGLRVVERTIIRKERRLPLKGELLVSVGEKVTPDSFVAKAHLPGQVELVNVANVLGIDPKEIVHTLQKKEGEKIQAGEVLAKTSGLFGLFKSECVAPLSGTIEAVSEATGKATLRKDPTPVFLAAFIEGVVESIFPNEGVVIRSWGAYAQGIFGIGGETWGPLHVNIASREESLTEEQMSEQAAGSIVVAGSYVGLRALKRAVEVGVKGIITGGVDDQDLKEFLGVDLGVAITGHEQKGITLIITEGFGKIAMAEKTFNLLKKSEGRLTSIHGKTQIRAGVIRPEIIVPFLEEISATSGSPASEELSKGLSVGNQVRIIREPHFGALARVTALPVQPYPLETEAKARVVEVLLEDGEKWILPRANVELV